MLERQEESEPSTNGPGQPTVSETSAEPRPQTFEEARRAQAIAMGAASLMVLAWTTTRTSFAQGITLTAFALLVLSPTRSASLQRGASNTFWKVYATIALPTLLVGAWVVIIGKVPCELVIC